MIEAVSGQIVPQYRRVINTRWVWNLLGNYLRRGYTNLEMTRPEYGSVNGILFQRVFYKGNMVGTGSLRHGFVYLNMTGVHILLVLTEDDDLYYSSSGYLAEAATLTLRRLPYAAPVKATRRRRARRSR